MPSAELDLAGLGGGGSDSGDEEAPASELGTTAAGAASDNESDYSMDVQECNGCSIQSTNCPISVIQEKPKRVKWARYRNKSFKNKRTGVLRKFKTPSGKWCGNCFSFWRTNFKRELPHLEDWDTVTTEKVHIKRKFRKMQGNWVIKKGGGAVRLRGSQKKKVTTKKSVKQQLVDGGVYFYTEKARRKKFGCPRENKAKKHVVKQRDGTELHGYAVRHGEEGVFQLKNIVEDELALEEAALEEGDALHEDHADEVFAGAQADAAAAGPSIMNETEARERARLAELKRRAAEACDLDEPGDDGPDGSSSDGESEKSEGKSFSAGDSDSEAPSDPGKDADASKKEKARSKARGGSSAASVRSSTPATSKADEKAKSYAKELLSPLEEALGDFLDSKWSAIKPRPLGHMLTEIQEKIGAANRFLKAKGANTTGQEIASLAEHVEMLTHVCAFKKGFNKLQSLEPAAAKQTYQTLKTKLKGKQVPGYIAKVVSGKNLSAVDSLGEQLNLIQDSNADGLGMVPVEVIGTHLDQMKTMHSTDHDEHFKQLVTSVASLGGLPKTIVDDMKAINVYYQTQEIPPGRAISSAMRASVQTAVTRLTQKKDSSVYLVLIKRRKPIPFENALKGLTEKLKEVQATEQKQQVATDITKSLNSSLSMLPATDRSVISHQMDKYNAQVTRCSGVNWTETNGDEVTEVMVTFTDRMAASIMFQVPGNILEAEEGTVKDVLKWVQGQALSLAMCVEKLRDIMAPASPRFDQEISPRVVALRNWAFLLQYCKYFKVVDILASGDPTERLNVALSKMTSSEISGSATIAKHAVKEGNTPYPTDLLSILSTTIEIPDSLNFTNVMTNLCEFHKLIPGPLCKTMQALMQVNSENGVSPVSIADNDLNKISVTVTGSLDIPEEVTNRVRDEKLTSILGKLDGQISIGLLYKSLAEKYKDTFGDEQIDELPTAPGSESLRVPFLMKLVPALCAAIAVDTCDQGSEKLHQGFVENNRDVSELVDWMSREGAETGCPSEDTRQHLSHVLKHWTEAKKTNILGTLEKIAGKLETLSNTVQPNMIDCKDALKDLNPEKMEVIKDMPGRVTLMETIRSMNVKQGMWKKLSCPVAGLFDNMAQLEEKVQEAVKEKNKAKTMVAIRSGMCLLLAKDGAALVGNFFKELKAAKAAIPAKLKKALESLQTDAGLGGGEDDAE
ncbi:unnamed protein product, partial [Prorocentrum cordatum]